MSEVIVHRYNDNHPDVLMRDLWRIGMCEACRFEGISIKKYKSGLSEHTYEFCLLCATTFISNAVSIYPQQYEDRNAMQALGYCTNLLLKEVRELRAEIGRLSKGL